MGIRVGVVDDELFFREAIAEVLEAAGFDCLAAEDGAQALELASDPDLGVLVLDIRMPEINLIHDNCTATRRRRLYLSMKFVAFGSMFKKLSSQFEDIAVAVKNGCAPGMAIHGTNSVKLHLQITFTLKKANGRRKRSPVGIVNNQNSVLG